MSLVLITGASGQLGTQLLTRPTSARHRMRALGRRGEPAGTAWT